MFVTNIKCPYFKSGIENFGLIMKGKSLENIDKIYKNFDHGFIINNFDLETDRYGKYLEDKELVHFVNNLFTRSHEKVNYDKLNIKRVNEISIFLFEISKSLLRYKL